MVRGVAHVAGPRRQGSEQRRQRAPHLAEVLQKLSVKRFTATSCNGLGTPGEGVRAEELVQLSHHSLVQYRLHGISALDALILAAQGTPFIPGDA
jgi:hypothetical protein